MKHNLSYFFLHKFWSLVFLFFINDAFCQYIFDTTNQPNKISLHPYATIVDVKNQNLSIETIDSRFENLNPQKIKSENDDLGFTDHHFWVRIVLDNQQDSDFNYYLETARPITDLVELYQVHTKSNKIDKMVNGDAMPYLKRSFQDRKTIFKVCIKSKTKVTFYLHLKSDGEVIKLPLMLYSHEAFLKESAFEQLFFGIFYGILLLTAIIYLFFFFALKEKTLLYYILYVVFIGFMHFSLDGYFYQLITPNGGWFSRHSVLLFAMIAALLLGKYSEVFLNIKTHNNTIFKLFNVAYAFALTLIFCLIFIPSMMAISYPLANFIGLLVLILIIVSIVYLYRNYKPVDPFFSIGILFLIIGFGIFILNNFGQIPNSFLTQNSSKIGTGLEIIFLSLSMGNLVRDLKIEKNKLNDLALYRLEEMNDMKSYFLSNISHELRTPLNAIMNLIDSISKEVGEENVKNKCKVIKYSSHSLLSSVNDILDFSKIEKNELIIESVLFEPVKVLEHLKNNAVNRAKDQGLDFQFSKSDSIPELLKGDVTRLVQIVNNVLSNAVKFTPEGFVKFHIDSKTKNATHTTLLLTISDSGIGISKEKMTSIFDSFSQNNINNKRKYGGLGLGLYIVKTLVDLQEGTITMNSQVNSGTTCEISIDYEIVKKETKDESTLDLPVYDLKGKTILVVEDNAINQMVIKMITKKWLNTTVVYANNGQEGLDVLQTQKFDLILMDLQMPVMDGYEATIAIRNGDAGQENIYIPIIAVTADVMETTKMRVKEIGMNHYLSKPIKNDTLFEAIKNLV